MYGSYAALDGGTTLQALEAMTGDRCFRFKLDGKTRMWQKWDLIHVQQPGKSKEGVRVALQLANEKPVNLDDMFQVWHLQRVP
jgi:hypothetical protein